jgi:hypothetical protein
MSKLFGGLRLIGSQVGDKSLAMTETGEPDPVIM